MNSTRRRPRPAVQRWEKRGWVKLQFLRLYARHDEFRQALLKLYETHCAGQEPSLVRTVGLSAVHEAATPEAWGTDAATWPDAVRALPDRAWAHGYLAAMTDTSRRFGLDRLGAPRAASTEEFRPSRGQELLHAWCCQRAEALASGQDWPPAMFGTDFSWGGPQPDIGEVTFREEIPGHGPGGEALVLLEEHPVPQPLVHIRIDDRWDPRDEPMAKAKKRLLARAEAEINSSLARIAADAEAQGYEFSDTTPKAREHLHWLFEHVALRKSYSQIAREHLGNWDQGPSVYNRTKPYADLLGIALGRNR